MSGVDERSSSPTPASSVADIHSARAQSENPLADSPSAASDSEPLRFGDEATCRGLVFNKPRYDCSGLGEASAGGGRGEGERGWREEEIASKKKKRKMREEEPWQADHSAGQGGVGRTVPTRSLEGHRCV